jgi:CDP-diacylglycerol--glycerol-3-phosphate 3-phosphatidyltransferase
VNLPNKLSIARVLCIPAITVLLYMNDDTCRLIAGVLFILGSLTDLLDGHIARKYNLITDFGKFIDPVADKLLVLSTMIMLVYRELLPAWLVVLILARELSVDGLRMIAVTKGKVIAAGMAGKIKTVSQMMLILFLLVTNLAAFSHWAGIALCVWVAVITLYSGVEYFRRNASLLSGG